MYVQKESVNEILLQCKEHSVKVIAGGPLFTQDYKNYPQIDHFILNEAEITMPCFYLIYKMALHLKKNLPDR